MVKAWMKWTAAGALILAGAQAQAGLDLKLDQDGSRRLQIGADEQMRLEDYNRNIWQGPDHPGTDNGPDVQYLRTRERVWGKLTLSPDTFLYGRLVHRAQYYASRDGAGSNNGKSASWHWPDEVVVDSLFLNMESIGGSGWSLRAGRFDLVDDKGKPLFGNGMVLLDGTPRDGGRTLYFDGAVATYRPENERDTFRLAALYGNHEDWMPVMNDQDRQLRRGDTWIGGGSWVHTFCQEFNTELYYFHVDINDNAGEKENAQLEVPGIRVFGSPHKQIDYSIEYAHEFGHYQGGVAGGGMQDCDGSMVDARLALKASEGTWLEPVVKPEFTWMSGDKKSTGGTYEGWHPVYAEYPIWREELYPQINKGAWTNLYQYRLGVDLTARKGGKDGVGKVTLCPAWTTMYADRGELGTGGGNHIGEMASLFVDYKATKWWTISLLGAQFFPGSYYADGHAGQWIRLEMTFTY